MRKRISLSWLEQVIGQESVMPPIPGIHEVLGLCMEYVLIFSAIPIARVWAGLLDNTPDALPVIERTPEMKGLVIAAGFSGHAFCSGPITGRLICELVTSGETSLPIDAFRRARFAAGTAAR